MKVCFTIGFGTPNSGITKAVINIVNLLANDERYEVHVLCLPDLQKETLQMISDKVITDSFHQKYSKISAYFGAMSHCRKYIRQNSIDVLVISGMEWVLFYRLGLIGNTVSMIAWEHRNFVAGPKFRLEWFGKRIACKHFDGIINITKRDQKLYRNYSKTAKLYQIYNVCGLKPNENVAYNASSQKIISVGYLAPIKGFDMLIDVAYQVLPSHPDWSWDIYGEGEMREELQVKIDKLNLGAQLKLRGFNKNINALYKEYSFMVMTSRAEGFGMVLIEAQRSGLPIVSFDIPCGPSDTIVDGLNGYLVEAFNLEKMTKKIESLIENENIRVGFSQKSCICHKEMGNEYIKNKWVGIFGKIMKNKESM